jgi:hypothetical protein
MTVIPRGPPALLYAKPGSSELKSCSVTPINILFRDPNTAPFNIVLLNGIQQGSGIFNRIGTRIEMKSVKIRGLIRPIITSVQSSGRMILFYDRQPSSVGTPPTASDLLQDTDQTGTSTTIGSSEININNRDRFAIIRDSTFYFPAVTFTAGVVTNPPVWPTPSGTGAFTYNEYVKLKGLLTQYKSNSNPSTVADIATGSLWLAWTQHGTPTAGSWEFDGGVRLRYNDK